MRDYDTCWNKRAQCSERALKSPYFPSHGFARFPSVKTCSINAPQRVFSEKVVLEYPPQIGGREDFQTDSLSQHRPQRQGFTITPWGNDGIDTHVGKRWKISVSLHRPYEAQIELLPIPHNRFENSFVRNPYPTPGKRCRKSFQQSLGKPCSVYVEAKKQVRSPGKMKLLFFHAGFPTLPQGLLQLFFKF